jgi:hypothetical protein
MTRAAADLMASMKALTDEVEAETGLLRRGAFAELGAAVTRKQEAADPLRGARSRPSRPTPRPP